MEENEENGEYCMIRKKENDEERRQVMRDKKTLCEKQEIILLLSQSLVFSLHNRK